MFKFYYVFSFSLYSLPNIFVTFQINVIIQNFERKCLSEEYSTVRAMVKKGRVIQNICATKQPVILEIRNV